VTASGPHNIRIVSITITTMKGNTNNRGGRLYRRRAMV